MFHLVGSRFYGTHRDDSDWDYIARDTPQNREYCEMLGLKIVKSPSTGGLHYWGRVDNTLWDVLLVDKLEPRLYARDEIAKLPNVRELSKSERHQKVREIIDAYELG